jgi:hypothetical protein
MICAAIRGQPEPEDVAHPRVEMLVSDEHDDDGGLEEIGLC